MFSLTVRDPSVRLGLGSVELGAYEVPRFYNRDLDCRDNSHRR